MIKINVKTPSGTTLTNIDCDYELARPVVFDRMEAREMELTVDRRLPITQFSIVTAKDGNMVKFRGYCESNSIDISDGSKTTWTVKGMENLLNARFAVRYFYPMGKSTLEEILTDELTDNTIPGLIAQANSAAPPGLPYSVYDADTNIIKLAGYGSQSYFGTRDLYVVGNTAAIKLTDAGTLELLEFTDTGYYRDADDLYIRVDNQKCRAWYMHGGLLVDGAHDTTVRLGEVYDTSQTLLGDLETNLDEIGDLITDLITASNLYVRVRDDDNYTYIDMMIADGRGASKGLYTIREGDRGFCSIEKSTSGDPKTHCTIGQGFGEQRYSIDDPDYMGLQIHELLEVESGFAEADGMFQDKVDAHYTARQQDQQYDIEVAKQYQVYPGDYFKFYPLHSTPGIFRSQEIVETPGITKLSLGHKDLTWVDVEDARESTPRGFTDKYLRNQRESLTKTETIKVSDPTHIYAPTGMEFYVPPGVDADKYNAKITLGLTISPVDNTAMWDAPIAYVIGDEVYCDDSDDITKLYRCIKAHTSGSTSKPGNGVSWATYWIETSEVKDLDLGRCALEVKIDDVVVPDGAIVGLCIGQTTSSSIPEIDVTDSITTKATNTVKVWVHMADEYEVEHTDEEDHPGLSVSASMNFYRRLSI